MLNTEVTFAPGSVNSKFKPFDCKSKVLYEPNTIEVDALFQGNLPEPNPAAAAARLGFPKGDIPERGRALPEGAAHLSLPRCQHRADQSRPGDLHAQAAVERRVRVIE